MIPLVVSLALAADCPTATHTTDLVSALVRADSAFAAMDLDGFEQARGDALRALECLGDPVSPVDAAWVHRVQALSYFVSDDAPSVRRAFQSSLAIQPGYRLAPTLAPPGNPLAQLYDEAAMLPPSATELLPSTGQAVLVDGVRAISRPTERPAVVQGLDASGAVEASTWLAAGAPLPTWIDLAAPPPVAKVKKPHKVSVPLLVASGASLVTGGALYGYAWTSHSAWADPDTPLDRLDGLRGQTNGALVASGVLTGVALGLGTAAVVVPW